MGWEQLAYAVIMMIVSSAITAYMAPKPSSPVAGQLDVPVAEDGATVIIVFGTELVKDAKVIWYGDAGTTPIYSDGGNK